MSAYGYHYSLRTREVPGLVYKPDPFWPEPGGMWLVYVLSAIVLAELAFIAWALFWRNA